MDLICPLGEQTAVEPDIRGCPEQGPITLRDTGTSTLVVSADDNDPSTGTYTLRLLDEAP